MTQHYFTVRYDEHVAQSHLLTRAQYDALLAALVAHEYGKGLVGYKPRPRVTRVTSMQYPWKLTANAQAVGALGKKGLVFVETDSATGESRAAATHKALAALAHDPQLRARVEQRVRALREEQARSDREFQKRRT